MAAALLHKPIYGFIRILNVKLPYNMCSLFIFFVLSESSILVLNETTDALQSRY
jgi:hypothetical protein